MQLGNTKIKLDKAALNIVLWNLIPYLGVYFLGWQPFSVFICYALETIVIGIFNVFKITAVYYYGRPVEENSGVNDMGLFAIPAFITSYGLLVYIQLGAFFGELGKFFERKLPLGITDGIKLFMDDKTTFWAIFAFVVFNGYSFVNDFILTDEYTKRNTNEQLMEPFPRVAIIQLIVMGGFLYFFMVGGGIGIVIALSFLKIIFEVILKDYKVTEIFRW